MLIVIIHKYFICLFIIIFISLINSSALYSNNIDGAVGDSTNNSLVEETENNLTDNDNSNTSINSFSAHRSNYLLPFTYSNNSFGRMRKEAKFQISVKQRFIKFYGWAFYFGYSQKSFWQVYDYNNSRPFRESNFNPELFIRTKTRIDFRGEFGIEHESNGQNIPSSRSWNRIYIAPHYENKYAVIYFKGWWRIIEKKKTNSDIVSGDDNPDIYKYYGHGELGITFKLPSFNRLYISTISRWNIKHNRGSIEANATFPGFAGDLSLMIQYWNGYGESLIDYNVKQQKIGFGMTFTR
jgi:phospholipase A1/A2